jgi:hypothetical protein
MKIQVSKDNVQQVIEHCKFIVIKKEDVKINKIECGSLPGNIKINYAENQNIVFNYLNDNIVYYTKENAIKNETSEKIIEKKRFLKPLIQDPNDVQRRIPSPLSNKKEEINIENKEEEDVHSKEYNKINKDNLDYKNDKEIKDIYNKRKLDILIYGIADYIKEHNKEIEEHLNKKPNNKKEIIDNIHEKFILCQKSMIFIKNIIKHENYNIDDKNKFGILERIGFQYFMNDNLNEKEYIYDFDKKLDGLTRSLRTWSRVKEKAIEQQKLEQYYQTIMNNNRKILEKDLCINNIYNLIGHTLTSIEEKQNKEN